MDDQQDKAAEPLPPFARPAPHPDAFAYFSRFRPALVRYFQRRMQVEADAQDLAHEVLLRLANRPLRDIQQPEAYLFQTAANVLRDQWRKDASRHADRHLPLTDEMPGLESAPSEEQVHQGREALWRLTAALNALPAKSRSMFVLHRFAGLGYSEIARRFGVSVSAVEKHLTRAMLEIKRALEEG